MARVRTESYAAMGYRHGPVSVSDRSGLVCCLGTAPSGPRDEVESTGALFAADAIDRSPRSYAPSGSWWPSRPAGGSTPTGPGTSPGR
ncbi:hypothetical protein [Streptomyces sp. NPDC087215]|uniref:hypothetical protein n=1 Tax=Streptomyces sp. NPDC087215 TaxID=3365767 RepID=UPI00381BA705